MFKPLDIQGLEQAVERLAQDQKPLVRIVDDEAELRQGLASLLMCEDLDYVAFASAEDYLLAEKCDRPGCLILDIRMTGMSGLQLQNQLNELGEVLPIIFLSGHGTLPIAVGTLKKGAVDFLEKPFDPDVLIQTVHSAIKTNLQTREKQDVLRQTIERFSELSDRERQVLKDVAAGLPNKAIGEHLGISPRTVEIYRGSCLKKLCLHKAEEASRVVSVLKRVGVLW
ncbi:MAG: response regulator [Sutterellaceae bacterium]|nr:response regulator [Sutterellaceae bacterium]